MRNKPREETTNNNHAKHAAIQAAAIHETYDEPSDPTEPIRMLGLMLADTRRLSEIVKDLPTAGETYFSDLRMIRAIGLRFVRRATRLMEV